MQDDPAALAAIDQFLAQGDDYIEMYVKWIRAHTAANPRDLHGVSLRVVGELNRADSDAVRGIAWAALRVLAKTDWRRS